MNFEAFIGSFKYVIEGWLGIFLVMGIIIAAIYGLNEVAAKLEEKAEKKES